MFRQPVILIITAVFAAVGLIGTASTAFADGDDDQYYEDEYAADVEEAEESDEVDEELPERLKYARNGFYLYGGLTLAAEQLPDSVRGDNPLGVNFRMGARLRHYFGVEFEYQTMPGWDLYFDDAPTLKQGIDIHNFTVNAKAFLLPGRIQPFVQAGIGAMIVSSPADNDDVGFSGRFGGGVAFMIDEYWAVSMTGLYALSFSDLNAEVGSGIPGPQSLGDLSSFQLIWAVGYHF